jgi:hypothetical protein
MGTRLIFLGPLVVTNGASCMSLLDWTCSEAVPGNSSSIWTVPETDTGGLIEHIKALERMVLKELGKLPP